MSLLTTVGIFIAIIFIIYLTARSLHIVLVAPLATFIVIITNNMNFWDTMLGKSNSYMAGLSGFLMNNFAIFFLGSILAGYMEKSGAALAIAKYIIAKTGKNNPLKMLLAITLITTILTYGGISIFIVIFAIIPLAKPLFKELNINWELFPIPVFLGASTFTMTMLPATPSLHNTLPIKTLGTSLTAAPLLSIIGTVVILIFGVSYMHYSLKKSLNNNEKFDNFLDGNFTEYKDNKKLPNIFLSILPILSLIIIIFLFTNIKNIVLIALSISIILAAFLFNSYLDNQKNILNTGTNSSIMPAFATSSTVAFGTVLTSANGFEVIKNLIMNISDYPVVGLAITTALLSGIIGSSSGAIGIVMTTLVPNFLNSGINPEVLHRIIVVASACLTVVPQSGVMITFHSLAGLSLKRGFKHSFWIVNIGHIIVLVIMLLLAQIIY